MATKKKVIPIVDVQSCVACRFFLANDTDQYGYCRRYPPAFAIDDEGGGFTSPSTTATEWCGEFAHILNS